MLSGVFQKADRSTPIGCFREHEHDSDLDCTRFERQHLGRREAQIQGAATALGAALVPAYLAGGLRSQAGC
jgi:hypothetical protein